MNNIYQKPAFPQQNVNKDFYPGSDYEGATLLDYFAIRIVQGELASQEHDYKDYTEEDFENLAKFSYCLAQTMMLVRGEYHE